MEIKKITCKERSAVSVESHKSRNRVRLGNSTIARDDRELLVMVVILAAIGNCDIGKRSIIPRFGIFGAIFFSLREKKGRNSADAHRYGLVADPCPNSRDL